MSICSVLNSLYDKGGNWNNRVMPGSEQNKNETFADQVNDSILASLKSRSGSGEWDDFVGGHITNHSDKVFAEALQGGSGDNISTEKSINWQATGESALTGAQIDYLKENYDIEHMDSQDYYNLIADLTNMNVISAKDIAKNHIGAVTTSNAAGFPPSHDTYGDKNGDAASFIGNVYGKILERSKLATDVLERINTGENFSSAQVYLNIKEIYEDQKRVYDKFLDILEKIVR